MSIQERTVICILDHPLHNPSQGLLKVLFEKISDTYFPVNSVEQFCDTESVFITNGYEDLEERYVDRIFELRVIPSKNDLKEGDCKYISTSDYVTNITSAFACAEIIQSVPPTTDHPTIIAKSRPLTNSIFVSWEDSLHGPFNISEVNKDKFDEYTFEIKLDTRAIEIKSANNKISLPSYHYFSISKDAASSMIASVQGHIQKSFVGSVLELMNNSSINKDSFVDFISDDSLVSKYGAIIANSTKIRNFSKAHIRLIKDQVRNLKEYRVNKSRFERLFKLFEQPEIWGRERNIIMDEFFLSEEGKFILENYITENKENLIGDRLKDFEEEIQEESKILRESITALERQKHDIEVSIRSKKQEMQNIRDEDLEAKVKLTEQEKNNLDEQLKEQRDELSSLQNSLHELKFEYNEYKNLDELTTMRQNLKGAISIAEGDLSELEKQIDNISKEVEDKNNELLGKLVELKPKVDMLSGVLPTQIHSPIIFDSKANFFPTSYSIGERQEVLESISDQLSNQGRKVDFEELTNIVTSLAQTQFTLFSGLPGTGKTSLGKLLGKAMGLENRLLNIPVARGWTSQRDVIGFYNTLSQSYVPSATGLYDLLGQVQKEDDGSENTPAIVLLDEFNLSQPEHYFSPFMEMSDPESNRTIYTGDPECSQLYVPHYVRFLGTINNDESVQALTPRMLDRCAIINFEEHVTSGSAFDNDAFGSSGERKVMSGNDFIKLFSNTSYTLPPEIARVLDEISDVLHDDDPKLGAQVIVSYRKIKAICGYYNVASSLMISDTLTALDYAVSQHIIPLINGFGDGFGERLKKLYLVIPVEMEKSRKRLDRVIVQGEQNLNTFGAFL